MKVLTTEEMRRIEREADAGGLSYATMMENAGRAIAESCPPFIPPNFGGERGGATDRQILVLVGPGNNGGDGLVAGRYLHDAGAYVTFYIWKRRIEDDENFRLAAERDISTLWAEEDDAFAILRRLLGESDVIVDALLGTGVSRPIEGSLKEILTVVGEELRRRRESKGEESLFSPSLPSFAALPSLPVLVAVDVPTGLNCDTGAIDPAAVPADLTVTFGFPKRGQFLFPGAEYVGQLIVADIEIPPHLADDVQVELATPEMVRELLPPRPLKAHKGTFGKALVVAGSVNYTGAAYLASAAATRVGTGLVTLALAESIHPILASKLSEVTFLLLPQTLGVLVPDAIKVLGERIQDYDALLLGPGLGHEKETVQFVQQLLNVEPGKRDRIGFLASEEAKAGKLSLPPLVIDADGLNALADTPHWWEQLKGPVLSSVEGPSVLTPHPGEMSRLTGLTVREIEANRLGVARQMAEKWRQVVILKGAYTVIADPGGRVVINPFANPGLATAGSGDVLGGAIVGFLAQGLAPFDAALVGTYLHGLAGELVRKELGGTGMVAGDLLPMLPKVIKLLHHRSG
ncbi:MAG: NAD(P)H-hydrate dehydratase [Anaerolineae bacterium]|nr:NAD(P)H-hydrate dehydratase [Anaerolineae bacterium]